VFQVTRLTGASFIVSTPKCATARGASDHQERPEASSRQPAMMDVIKLAGELPHSIESRKQIPACLALQWNETEDETALENRFGRRHEDRRQVWWLSPHDRNWLRFPDRNPRTWLGAPVPPRFPFSKPVSAVLIREIAFENGHREPRTWEITSLAQRSFGFSITIVCESGSEQLSS
jgi:hypothetical protein